MRIVRDEDTLVRQPVVETEPYQLFGNSFSWPRPVLPKLVLMGMEAYSDTLPAGVVDAG